VSWHRPGSRIEPYGGGPRLQRKCNVTGELYFAARLLGPSKQKDLALKGEAYCQPPNVHSSHTKFRSRPASDFEEANCVESWVLVLMLHILGYWRKTELRFPSLLHTTNTITSKLLYAADCLSQNPVAAHAESLALVPAVTF
jgi:hypothetical protein